MTFITSAMFELDRYYTPEDVARSALGKLDLPNVPRSCADSSCGSGRLLDAAGFVFGDVACVGIDRDKTAIKQLKKRRPRWTLAAGDILSRRSYLNGFGRLIPGEVDLLVLNPPFSQVSQKRVDILYEGELFKGSIAMACLARSLELFQPKIGAVLIAPESLVYSQTDAEGRRVLSESYGLRKLSDLRCNTFRGARAHACVLELLRGAEDVNVERPGPTLPPIRVEVLRGALPVHSAVYAPSGTHFLHSTDIRSTVQSGDVTQLTRTERTAKGLVRGWVILIPRVGVPDPEFVREIFLPFDIQLSDCVIALCCATETAAKKLSKRLLGNWDEFYSLYKGTGARYLTVAHLNAWLSRVGIVVSVR